MANPSIRGHQGALRIIRDGGDVNIATIISADVNQDSTFQRTFYVGQKVPEGDQSLDGWSGTIEMEVKGPEIDEFMDALQADNLAGIGVKDYALVLTEDYSDGQSKTYVYPDAQFRLTKRIAGSNEKVIKSYEVQMATRIPID